MCRFGARRAPATAVCVTPDGSVCFVGYADGVTVAYQIATVVGGAPGRLSLPAAAAAAHAAAAAVVAPNGMAAPWVDLAEDDAAHAGDNSEGDNNSDDDYDSDEEEDGNAIIDLNSPIGPPRNAYASNGSQQSFGLISPPTYSVYTRNPAAMPSPSVSGLRARSSIIRRPALVLSPGTRSFAASLASASALSQPLPLPLAMRIARRSLPVPMPLAALAAAAAAPAAAASACVAMTAAPATAGSALAWRASPYTAPARFAGHVVAEAAAALATAAATSAVPAASSVACAAATAATSASPVAVVAAASGLALPLYRLPDPPSSLSMRPAATTLGLGGAAGDRAKDRARALAAAAALTAAGVNTGAGAGVGAGGVVALAQPVSRAAFAAALWLEAAALSGASGSAGAGGGAGAAGAGGVLAIRLSGAVAGSAAVVGTAPGVFCYPDPGTVRGGDCSRAATGAVVDRARHSLRRAGTHQHARRLSAFPVTNTHSASNAIGDVSDGDASDANARSQGRSRSALRTHGGSVGGGGGNSKRVAAGVFPRSTGSYFGLPAPALVAAAGSELAWAASVAPAAPSFPAGVAVRAVASHPDLGVAAVAAAAAVPTPAARASAHGRPSSRARAGQLGADSAAVSGGSGARAGTAFVTLHCLRTGALLRPVRPAWRAATAAVDTAVLAAARATLAPAAGLLTVAVSAAVATRAQLFPLWVGVSPLGAGRVVTVSTLLTVSTVTVTLPAGEQGARIRAALAEAYTDAAISAAQQQPKPRAGSAAPAGASAGANAGATANGNVLSFTVALASAFVQCNCAATSELIASRWLGTDPLPTPHANATSSAVTASSAGGGDSSRESFNSTSRSLSSSTLPAVDGVAATGPVRSPLASLSAVVATAATLGPSGSLLAVGFADGTVTALDLATADLAYAGCTAPAASAAVSATATAAVANTNGSGSKSGHGAAAAAPVVSVGGNGYETLAPVHRESAEDAAAATVGGGSRSRARAMQLAAALCAEPVARLRFPVLALCADAEAANAAATASAAAAGNTAASNLPGSVGNSNSNGVDGMVAALAAPAVAARTAAITALTLSQCGRALVVGTADGRIVTAAVATVVAPANTA